MKIAIAQQNYRVGDLAGNIAKMKNAVSQAVAGGADMVVFAEDAMAGTPLCGLVDFDDFKSKAHDAINRLTGCIPHEITAVFGIGEIAPDTKPCLVHVEKGNVTYVPGDRMEVGGCKAIFNIRGVPFGHRIADRKFEDMQHLAMQEDSMVVMVNQCGASTDTIYFGGSMVCMPDGRYCKLPLFEECLKIVDTDAMNEEKAQWRDKTSQMHDALILGIRDYFGKNGFSQACVALSGGLDSAVVVALAVEALGAENVRALMLPSGFSSTHSVEDSQEMVRRLGIRSDLISIEPVFRASLKAMQPILGDNSFGVTEENVQSRIRCMMTMALSNKTGALMLNTSNKSEAAVGYGTLYGDTGGAISVIGDLYKTEVYELAEYINANFGDPIPRNIIEKAPSAELRPDQKDSDSLPEYPLLDGILYRLVELGRLPHEIVAEGFLGDTVKQVAGLLWQGDFKRRQYPPAFRMSGATFGVERVFPITKSKF